ncbi:MAG: cation:proton antiporter [Gudongella sp.]|nr:cation:proton antiporter [Gudongella sp.]
MLTSLAIMFLLGLTLGKIFKSLKLPSLIGMILAGMIVSPHALNLLDSSILMISADLRQIALIIILTRAGLSLRISDLKKVGRPAILMCFLPALLEIVGVILIAPKLLGISMLEAAIIGSIIAAVSPAIIVPRMIKIINEGYGRKNSIPQLILAGASVDDVFVIVLFTIFTSLAIGGEINAFSFVQIPISIILGIIVGVLSGILLTIFFKKFHMRDTIKIMIILSISFLLIELEHRLDGAVTISGLLAIMSMGITILREYEVLAKRLEIKYNKLWVGAELMLFVLVGATVDISYAMAAGLFSVILVLGALVFRLVGVELSLLKTALSKKEKLFTMIAYTPKATVQAAIGAVPLSMGLAIGQQALTTAVVSILITAPIGAILIDNLYNKLLNKE